MRILVVEDEHRIANTLQKGLQQEKHVVDVAYDGQTGLDLATSEEYDVLVLDVMLPKLSGLELCAELRRQHIHTPTLLLTAKSQIQDRVTGLDKGADDYLTKPFSFEELLARVRALGRRRSQPFTDDTLLAAELALNVKTYVVTRNHQEVHLSSQEFKLLEYFLRHPNQIISKQQIINHVWDYDSNVLPNTVEVYVRNLRQKIETPFPKLPAVIETVRGFGYKLKK